jgi:adenylate cyclase
VEGHNARGGGGDARPSRPTVVERVAMRGLRKHARKHSTEPLAPADWESYWRYAAQPRIRIVKRGLRALPSTPRCGYCGAPFAGLGGWLVRRLGYRPSRKNPNLCATCVELAPPGGMTAEVGVLFAALRGFTEASERRAPSEVSADLRRFYAHAEKTLFPEALIDKLIGDEVMALYLPPFVAPEVADVHDESVHRRIAEVMVDHARELLERVGYGGGGEPEFEVGIGLDFGEVFIGNIGDAAVHDFTAVGDVVNTAARLQGRAAGGEVVMSARLARLLPEPIGESEQAVVKGKRKPVEVRRIRWFAQEI